MKIKLLVLLACAFSFSDCSKGPHVDSYSQASYTLKYACYYSDSVFKTNRRIAICDTEAECNQICAKLQVPAQ